MNKNSFLKRINMGIACAFLAFVTLDFALFNVLQVGFSLIENQSIPYESANTLILLNFVAAAVGTAVWAFIPKRILNEKIRVVCFRASAGLSAILCAAAYFTSGTLAIICVLGATLSSALALCNLLGRLPGILSSKRIGIFVGCGLALSNLFGALMFSFPFNLYPSLAALVVIVCVAAVIAAIMKIPAKEADKTEKHPTVPKPPKFMVILVAVLFLGILIADSMAEHIFYFHEVFELLPSLGSILTILALLLYVLAGFLFDKKLGVYGFFAAFLFMGVSQAMALFFSGTAWMGLPYYFFNSLGTYIFLVFIIAAPIYYTQQGKRGIFPQLGYLCRNLFAFIVTLGFQTIQPEVQPDTFDYALGTVLLMTFAGIALSIVLINAQGKQVRAVAQAVIAADGESETLQMLKRAAIQPLSERECQIGEMTILGVRQGIIAETLNIEITTVKYHRTSLYNKFGVNSRDELVRRVEELSNE